MSYELELFDKLIYSSKENSLSRQDIGVIISREKNVHIIEEEYRRLEELFKKIIYSDKPEADITFYFKRYGSRLVKMQNDVVSVMNRIVKSLIVDGFDKENFNAYLNF